ncbi:hypothetical protein AYO44_07200 [Planctomycetaceae bacterium SCGC AG-212-F19]|nr:hypothetical protein AYO44_07200 [Planctomycetaceae bacterium SCGC AG-212-F19]
MVWPRLRILAISAVVTGLLGLASYWTTYGCWLGGFPAGEFRITIRGPANEPVSGAELVVRPAAEEDGTIRYTLDSQRPDTRLVSNDVGRIIAVSRGYNFGGNTWELFWVIPMGWRGPRYDCEIMAEGFRPLRFPLRRLFETPYLNYAAFPKTKVNVNGRELELPVYEHTFTLER